MIADVHAIDLDTFAVLPGMSNLEIAEPRLAIKGTLLLIAV